MTLLMSRAQRYMSDGANCYALRSSLSSVAIAEIERERRVLGLDGGDDATQ